MAKCRFLLLLAFCLVLVSLSVYADNSSNTTAPLNFSITECDSQCINGSVDWTTVFVCESGLEGVLYACCNNFTLCELRFNATCYHVVHLVPQVLPPDDGGDGDDGGDDDDGGLEPSSTSASAGGITDTGRRVMRLFVNGDIAGEPIYVSAHNIFGPMKGVKLLFFKDGSVVKTVVTDGETEVLLDEPGQYIIEASRRGYLNAKARLYLYARDEPVAEVEPPVVVAEPPVVEEPEDDYSPITSMTTISVPKKSLSWPKYILLLIGATAVMVFVYRKFRSRPKAEPKPDFGF